MTLPKCQMSRVTEVTASAPSKLRRPTAFTAAWNELAPDAEREFLAASVGLYYRLWLELEAVAPPRIASHCASDADIGLELVRLEICIVLDACGGSGWAMLLTSAERRSLRDDLYAVLQTLSEPDGRSDAPSIHAAQDLLVDAIEARLEQLSQRGGGKPARPATRDAQFRERSEPPTAAA